MTVPDDDEHAALYARLAQQEEIRYATRTPHRWTRVVGWAICLALLGAVVAAALQVHPW